VEESALDRMWGAVASGGYIMIPLAILSLLLYYQVIGLLIFVKNVDLEFYGETERRDIDEGEGDEHWEEEVLRYENLMWRFRQFVDSRLNYANALLVAAPLLGLLGTVVGMLDTFRGLSLQAGFETQQLVAEGVRRALITTETGLLVAIVGLFFVYWIKRVMRRRELDLLDARIIKTVQQGATHA